MDTLTLKDFIKQTLIDVCGAVEESRSEYGCIAPKTSFDPNDSKSTLIGFDVAVTVANLSVEGAERSIDTKAKMGISVLGMGANVGAKAGSNNLEETVNESSHVSRITFNIPVHFRYSEELRQDMKRQNKEANVKFSKINNQRRGDGF